MSASVESDLELAVDTLVNGRYKIVRLIAHGGMGTVYLAEDTDLRRKVALKLLSYEVSRDQELAQRFIYEAQNASRINHPNVVTIFDKGAESESGRQFLVTEFVDGVTLKDYLSTKKPTLYELASIALQVAEALTAAHQVGVVHRDIKPGNIMLLSNGAIKVLDFGLSKFVSTTFANQDGESITPWLRRLRYREPCLEHRHTCRPSKPAMRPPIAGQTSSVLESCSTSWPQGNCPFRDLPRWT